MRGLSFPDWERKRRNRLKSLRVGLKPLFMRVCKLGALDGLGQ